VVVVLGAPAAGIIHVNITEHSTAAWTGNKSLTLSDDHGRLDGCCGNRDAIYGTCSGTESPGMGIGGSSQVRPGHGKIRTRNA